MLHELKKLEGFTIGARDGNIGKVKDFYFDDETWVIRYLIVETGDWLLSRKVLIAPVAIHDPDWEGKILPVSIMLDQVRKSPDIDTEKPVSRQHEMQYLGYYGYPYYWDGSGMFSDFVTPSLVVPKNTSTTEDRVFRKRKSASHEQTNQAHHRDDDPHLRSCETVASYHIHASDGEIGHVHGYLIDEKSWAIRYIIVDTTNWWLGHQVLIAPEWFHDIDWEAEKVSVDLTRASVQTAPVDDENVKFGRLHEEALYAHYERVGYWPAEAANDAVALREIF